MIVDTLFKVRVITGASRNYLEIKNVVEGEEIFHVYVKSPPKGGEANVSVLNVLATHFDVAPSTLKIVRGTKSRNKIVSIRRISNKCN